MRIAIPLVQGQLSLHFGHCDEFALVDVNSDEQCVSGIRTLVAPSHCARRSTPVAQAAGRERGHRRWDG